MWCHELPLPPPSLFLTGLSSLRGESWICFPILKLVIDGQVVCTISLLPVIEYPLNTHSVETGTGIVCAFI